MTRPVVAIADSRSHYDGVAKALELIEDQISQGIKGKNKVLVKPNFVTTSRQLAATHVDAVKAILDTIRKYYSETVIIGEGPAFSSFRSGLENYNYLKLRSEYDVEFVDLNEDDYVEVEAFDSRLNPMNLRISKTVVESDYRISAALAKTHDFVIVTLAIKNMVVGSLVGGEKWRLHQGYKAMNMNIARLAKTIMPHLGVVDGYLGMEGRGPSSGDPIQSRFATASVYPVSLDAVTSKIMGFEPFDIGYLYHSNNWKVGVADLRMIDTVGRSIADVARRFRPHPRCRDMLSWR